MFWQVCTIEPSFGETTSVMHLRPFEGRHLVLNLQLIESILIWYFCVESFIVIFFSSYQNSWLLLIFPYSHTLFFSNSGSGGGELSEPKGAPIAASNAPSTECLLPPSINMASSHQSPLAALNSLASSVQADALPPSHASPRAPAAAATNSSVHNSSSSHIAAAELINKLPPSSISLPASNTHLNPNNINNNSNSDINKHSSSNTINNSNASDICRPNSRNNVDVIVSKSSEENVDKPLPTQSGSHKRTREGECTFIFLSNDSFGLTFEICIPVKKLYVPFCYFLVIFGSILFSDDLDSSNGSSGEPQPSRQRLHSISPNNTAPHQSNGLSNGNLTNGDDKNGNDNSPLESCDDSAKENKMVDGCGSLSKNGKILTDEELDSLSGDALKDLSPEQIAKRKEIVNKLQVQLRTEEMKLVLLKKLKQSQVNKKFFFLIHLVSC